MASQTTLGRLMRAQVEKFAESRSRSQNKRRAAQPKGAASKPADAPKKKSNAKGKPKDS